MYILNESIVNQDSIDVYKLLREGQEIDRELFDIMAESDILEITNGIVTEAGKTSSKIKEVIKRWVDWCRQVMANFHSMVNKKKEKAYYDSLSEEEKTKVVGLRDKLTNAFNDTVDAINKQSDNVQDSSKFNTEDIDEALRKVDLVISFIDFKSVKAISIDKRSIRSYLSHANSMIKEVESLLKDEVIDMSLLTYKKNLNTLISKTSILLKKLENF